VTPKPTDEMEIKDPLVIFNTVWSKLEAKYGRNQLRFPKELIWLGGAPGSGKGTNTPFIQRVRGISNPPIVMSDLLMGPEFKAILDQGRLVGDGPVFELLLERLLQKEYRNGVIVDGFPRTKIQVECTRLFFEKMIELRKEFMHIDDGFVRPRFRVAVLYVDEKESVERQIHRGKETMQYNQRVQETGVGKLREIRSTDTNEEAARLRYKIFKDHYSTLQTLREYFPFTIINASGTITEVEQSIIKEFKYQSSLELAQETFDVVQKIPTIDDVVKHARQELINRLDHYQTRHNSLFMSVVDLIQKEFVPQIRRHAITGMAIIRSHNALFDDPMAIEMVIDILSERGYHVLSDVKRWDIPNKISQEGAIVLKSARLFVFQVKFKRFFIRDSDSTPASPVTS